MAQQCFQNKIL